MNNINYVVKISELIDGKSLAENPDYKKLVKIFHLTDDAQTTDTLITQTKPIYLATKLYLLKKLVVSYLNTLSDDIRPAISQHMTIQITQLAFQLYLVTIKEFAQVCGVIAMYKLGIKEESLKPAFGDIDLGEVMELLEIARGQVNEGDKFPNPDNFLR